MSAADRRQDETLEPLQSFQNSSYLRPSQKWNCGHACGSCDLGPDAAGNCRAATECDPRRQNDSWVCNRSPLQGGKCEKGPSAEGECCRPVPPCVPVLGLRYRRNRFAVWCVTATLGLGLVMLGSDWRNEFLAPGGLTEQHAQLLHDSDSSRCAECHGAASLGLAGWTAAAMTPSRAIGKPQSQLCLECHDKSLPPDNAMAAHGMPRGQLTALTLEAQQRLNVPAASADSPDSEIACSTCHREHHGANFDLTAMSNKQCSTCHQDAFVDFAAAHPPFDGWPFRRRTRIAFDHVAHQAKYFPDSDAGAFDCRICHEDGGRTGIVRVNGFEKSCGSCHEKKIDQSMAQGLKMLALPMLDIQALRAGGFSIGDWPTNASGSFDGTIAPLTRLLLGSDRRAWSALEQFGPAFDFLDVDPENVDDLEAVCDIAWGIKQLVFDLTTDSRRLFRQRVERSLRIQISEEQAESLSAQLSPALISGLQRKWLPSLMKEVPAYRRKMGLPTDGFEGDVSLGEVSVGNLPASSRLGSAGGIWERDDETFELTMKPQKHASAFMHSWLELLARNTKQVLPETSWPLLEEVTRLTGLGQCISCHSVDQQGDQRVVNWMSSPSFASGGRVGVASLTKFAHEPHLLQPGFESCTACHALDPSQKVMENFVGFDPQCSGSNFTPMTQQDCARCHHPEGAGDSCLKCHDYHVQGHASAYSAELAR